MTNALRSLLYKHIITTRATLFRTVVGGLFELMPTWARGYTGLQLPVFNLFIPLTPDGLTDETLADTAAFFYSRSSLYAVEMMFDLVPEGANFLNERRYTPLPPQPAMVLGQDALRDHALSKVSSDIQVEAVSTVPHLTAFCSLQQQVFDFDPQDMLKRFPVTQLRDDKITHFLAFHQEEPVGAGTLVCAGGVASLWHVGTPDEHRHRGVATSLVKQMLSVAFRQECRSVMVFSTAQAYSFFGGLGFEIFSQRQWFLPESIEYVEEP
jgi:N-acetylglutamate synthase-like GNAT family acetyltransferase